MRSNQDSNDPVDRLLDQIATELRNSRNEEMPEECRLMTESSLRQLNDTPGNAEQPDASHPDQNHWGHKQTVTQASAHPVVNHSVVRFWIAVAAVLLVATSIGIGFWRGNIGADVRRVVEEDDPEITTPTPSPTPEGLGGDKRKVNGDGIIEIPIRRPAGLLAMEEDIDRIESELEDLRRQAKTLDARRRATELISKLAMLDSRPTI